MPVSIYYFSDYFRTFFKFNCFVRKKYVHLYDEDGSYECKSALSNIFVSTAKQPTQQVEQSDADPEEGAMKTSLENFKYIACIKSLYFSNLTNIPHEELKNRLTSIIRNSFR